MKRKGLTQIAVTGLVAVLLVAGLTSVFVLTDVLSVLSGVEGDNQYTVYNEQWTGYTDNYVGMELYGNDVTVESLDSSDESDVANVHYGSKSEILDNGESVNIEGFSFEVSQLQDTELWSDGYSYTYDFYRYVGVDVGLDVPESDFSMDLSNVSVEETGPGDRKVDFDVKVENGFNRLAVDSVKVTGLDENITVVEDSILSEGESKYDVSGSFSEYNISAFKVEENVEKELRLVVENPRVPADEGIVHIAPESSVSTSFPTGTTEPIDFSIGDITSSSVNVSTEVAFCGENASYSNGECVIEEDLHLRGDTCFLQDSYSIVTRTFSPGEYSTDDLDISPDYFCSRHPVIVTNDGVQTGTTLEPYREMIRDENFVVPEAQTYTAFWVVDTKDHDTVTVCEEGSFNQSTGNCEVNPGVIHQCSAGVWDPQVGSCVVTPDTKTVCEQGRYNSELGTCVYEPEVKSQCPADSKLGENGLCYSEANVKQVCPENVNGSIESGLCVSEATVVQVQDGVWYSLVELLQDISRTVKFW